MQRLSSRIFVLLLTIVLAGTVAGCGYRYRFHTDLPPSGTRVTETRHFALWGLTETAPFDLEEACPSGVAEFGSYVGFLDWLPALLTIGIYTPRTVYAVCSEK